MPAPRARYTILHTHLEAGSRRAWGTELPRAAIVSVSGAESNLAAVMQISRSSNGNAFPKDRAVCG